MKTPIEERLAADKTLKAKLNASKNRRYVRKDRVSERESQGWRKVVSNLQDIHSPTARASLPIAKGEEALSTVKGDLVLMERNWVNDDRIVGDRNIAGDRGRINDNRITDSREQERIARENADKNVDTLAGDREGDENVRYNRDEQADRRTN